MTTYVNDSEASTQRPDGTWRKARRVKQGYVPQEEVPLYESKGKQFAQRKTDLPPGMCPLVAEAAKKEREKQERAKAKKQQAKQAPQQQPGLLVLPSTKSNVTNHKRAISPVLPTSASKTTIERPTNTATKTANNNSVDKLTNDLQEKLNVSDDVQELSKKLKKFRKKLREIELIEEKMKNGDIKKLEKDQLEKVKRKKEIIKEIERLEDEESEESPGLQTNGID